MGCVPSAERGEIVAIELLRHNDLTSNADAFLTGQTVPRKAKVQPYNPQFHGKNV